MCSEILLERHFYPALTTFIRQILRDEPPASLASRAEPDEGEPPAKKRRLSSPSDQPEGDGEDREALLWIACQAACRCIDLFTPPPSQHTDPHKENVPAWSAGLKTHAGLLGVMLELNTALLKHYSTAKRVDLTMYMLSTTLSFWENLDPSASTRDGERQEALASYCLTPCVSLLDVLNGVHSRQTSVVVARKSLSRLLAIHAIFPLRKTFNEQFTKKWRATADVLLYEHMDTLLQAYDNLVRPKRDEDMNSRDVVEPYVQRFSWVFLDVAARSIPLSDLRRRQQEQHFLDTLFIWLVHVAWPNMPRVTSTGILQQALESYDSTWLSSLESLLHVALSRKLNVSIPVISYILQAVLSTDTQSSLWSLLVKVVQLDPSILISSSASPTTKDFLGQVASRIGSSTVSSVQYDLIRDQLMLPLVRNFARSRALSQFVGLWQQWLAEAMRSRYSNHSPDEIPGVLVWEDGDLFKEFETLSVLHAPPGMALRLLNDLIESVKRLREKVGPTADEFAKLAVFSTFLETKSPEGITAFAPDQLLSLFHVATDALHRKSDYQGQRWRLRKLVRLLVESRQFQMPSLEVDNLLESACGFISTGDVHKFDKAQASGATKPFLECFECFSLLLELAANSTRFNAKLTDEILYLQAGLDDATWTARSLWNGHAYACNTFEDLIMACTGTLLQKTATISMYPDVFQRFIQKCLDGGTLSSHQISVPEFSPNLQDVSMAILQDGEVISVPQLRDIILRNTVATVQSDKNNMERCRNLLRGPAIETTSRATAEKLADALRTRLFSRAQNCRIDLITQNLGELLRFESLFPGSSINPKHLEGWGALSNARFGLTESSDSLDLPKLNSDLSYSYLVAAGLLKQVFEKMWARAAASPNTSALTKIISWTLKDFGDSQKKLQKTLPLSCAHLFLLGAYSTIGRGDVPEHLKLREMRECVSKRIQHHLDKISQQEVSPTSLVSARIFLDAIGSFPKLEESTELRETIANLQPKLRSYCGSSMGALLQAHEEQVVLSTLRKCIELQRQAYAKNSAASRELLQELLNPSQQSNVGTYGWAKSLAAKADLVTRQTVPAEWSNLLAMLRQKSQTAPSQPTCAVLIASVIANVEEKHLSRYPQLAQEVAEIASLTNESAQGNGTGLLLALENCKQVLEVLPVVVNQSTLDRLLASLQALASSTTALSNDGLQLKPVSAHIFEHFCDVVGAILGRHRRRLSDRYHLLVPVLQALLRCLFWPGTKAVESQRGPAAIAVTAFGRTLPRWMRDSDDSLPLLSADQLSRVLSSICNPSVSAARSSNKRRNELNDEVKKARKLAGEHMQYLVTEYCRCILDGQISPLMKDQLMPGIYRVIDAIDRDLMRAMNAGMDASSRAIFKSLFEDWTKHGRWDKS